jgi:hypothetical protein
MMIIVTPTAKRKECYEARLGDGRVLVTASKQPFVDSARRLIELGYDPATVLVMRHAGSDTDCLTAQIGAAAKLRVKEDRNGPRFVPYEPISRRVKALASAKTKRVARVATAEAKEPSRRPGAAVAPQFPSAPVRSTGADTSEFEREPMSEARAPSVAPDQGRD